ncbi:MULTISPECIES: LLM class flavin-dependent oxidoreductase [unclassified Mycobacterium]|uniref:LLM class flavin-dependent oxidoreductase n=1 Tax=unclassified Mycobacterium TaxID=2642494 RepID=UPI0029C7921E|nr:MULTISPECIES: LLM class flavin-dependent oxidoreductase [unclassified Mycobacterium]
MREGKQRKKIHLGARFPDSDSRLEFESFQQLAQTAERGLFDFILLPEGHPDTLSMLAALAAVTERLGLVGTVNTTVNEPFEVARQFATLDHLSDGRAAWNIATSHSDGYERAAEFLTVAREFWDSWDADAIRADESTGVYVDPDRVHDVSHRGAHFDVRGLTTLPAGPQGHPILLQAGDSADGRDFGARHADALFTPHADLVSGQNYYADVKARVVAIGRDPAQVKVFAVATGGLGDTPEQVADELDLHVQSDACDGFILTPDGLDDFVAKVVPLLQERSAFRSEYTGTTLRDHLGVTAGLR